MSASKRSAFSLLGQPQPLPEDDAATVETPTPGASSEDPARPSNPVSPLALSKPEKAPPSTIRLNESAGRVLWEAFAVEKASNPFLSYRQFASDVIVRGLKARVRSQR